MVIGISLIIYISSIYSLKARAKLSPDSIDNSKKVHLHHLNMFGITFLLLNISLDKYKKRTPRKIVGFLIKLVNRSFFS